MVRKLVLAMAAAGALSSTTVNALGLGEINLRSTLNQPLDAQIELIEVKGLGQGDILPKLATKQDFSLAGVDRDFFLNNLKFKTVIRPDGSAYVEVSTRKPVREPYLNFLVELQWPNGRLLREYTVLLDPPTFTEEMMPPVAPPAAAEMDSLVTRKPSKKSSSQSVSKKPVPQKPATQASQPAKETSPQVASSEVEGGTYGKTTSKDTMWKIASTHRPSSDVTVQQTMLAIQELNPDAFINQNINLLKKGKVLRLPTLDQILQTTQRKALADVALQNQEWQERRALSAPQLDASLQQAKDVDESAPVKDGTLTLSSAGTNSAGSGGTDNGTSEGEPENLDALQNELAISQERLDKAVRESSEVSSKLGELEEQVETLQRLLSLKDEQLAALQVQLAQNADEEDTDSTLEQAQPSDETATVQGEVEAEETTATEMDASTTSEMPAKEVVSDAADVVTEQGESVQSSADKSVEAVTDTEAVQPQVEQQIEPDLVIKAEPTEKPADKVVPASVPEQVEDSGLLDELLQNPLYMYAGAGVLALLLVLMLVSRRKSDDELVEGSDLKDLAEEGDSSDEQLSETDQLESSEDGQSEEAFALGGDEELQQDEITTAQTADALGEADIYIAYGRYTQAVELLTSAISKEPARADLRVKLLEAYAEMQDVEAFVQQENELSALGDSIAMQEAEIFKNKFASGVLDSVDSAAGIGEADLEIDDLDEALHLDEMDSVDAPIEFSIDDLDLDSSEESFEAELSSDEVVELADDDVLEALEFDLDGDSDLSSEENLLADLESGLGDDLDSELDLELDELGDIDEKEFSLDEELSLDGTDEDSFELEDVDEESGLEFDVAGGIDVSEEIDNSELTLSTDLDEELLDDELDASLDANETVSDDFEFELGDVNLEEVEASEEKSESAGDSNDTELEESADIGSAEDLVETQLSDIEFELDENSVSDLKATDSEADSLEASSNESLDADQGDDVEIPGFDSDISALDEATESLVAEFDEESDEEMDEEFDFLAGTNETATKLDLARAYVDMGDVDGARDILEEVLKEGDESQLKEARELIDKI